MAHQLLLCLALANAFAVLAAARPIRVAQGPTSPMSLLSPSAAGELMVGGAPESAHHGSSGKSSTGGAVILCSLATVALVAVICYIRVTRKSAAPFKN